MSQLAVTRRKFVSLLATFALAMSMCVVAPATALADDYSIEIKATGQTAAVTLGSTIDMSISGSPQQFKVTTNMPDGSWHVDYKITATADGGAATINKHSGILTPSAAGTVTVTAYFQDQPQPSGVSTNPCYSTTYSASKTVTISDPSVPTYGFQGGDLQIQMTSFSPAVISQGDGIYNNSLTGVVMDDYGNITFNYTQNFGIGSIGIAAYQANNANNVKVVDANGVTVASVANDLLTIVQQGSSKTDLSVVVNAGSFADGTYTLVFTPDYIAGNGSSKLSSTVNFQFTI